MRKFRIIDSDTNETVDDVSIEWMADQRCADWNDAESVNRNRYYVAPYPYRGPNQYCDDLNDAAYANRLQYAKVEFKRTIRTSVALGIKHMLKYPGASDGIFAVY